MKSIYLLFAFSLVFFSCNAPEPEPCEPPPGGCPDGTVWEELDCLCNPLPPPPPPPPPPCEKPPRPDDDSDDDCTWNKKKCAWECPIPGPGPDVYLSLDEGKALLNGTNSENPGLRADTEDLEVNGRQGIDAILGLCPWATSDGEFPFFRRTAIQMATLRVETSMFIKESRKNFQKRLVKPNRRCDKSHDEHHPLYCERSDVQRTVWGEWRAGFDDVKARALGLEGEIAHCRVPLRIGCSDPKPGACDFDSVKGWCAMMRREDRRSCETTAMFWEGTNEFVSATGYVHVWPFHILSSSQ